MVEWLKRRMRKNRRHTPKDFVHYYITQEVIDFTVRVLQDYGNEIPASEGIVYWGGKQDKNTWTVFSAVAPAIETSRYGFQTSHEDNAQFVEFLSEKELLYVSQVHSHPSDRVNHSIVDDEETAFRSEGLISIVVPTFGYCGILPFDQCGIHLFTKRRFRRLSDKCVNAHFHVIPDNQFHTILKDFRHEKLV